LRSNPWVSEMVQKEPRIRPAGDQALLVEFGAEISPQVNGQVQAFTRRARDQKAAGIGEMIPSYCSVLVYYDPFLLSFSETASWVKDLLNLKLAEIVSPPKVKEIPVLYGGESGPDIFFVSKHNQISVDEVIRLHRQETYLVYVVGFSPGFAAMGTVPLKIQVPRLATPRAKVPAGSVGIGGQQTGIYAVESPGGWQLIGRTPLTLFEFEKDPPSFFQAGDYARFYPIDEKEFLRIHNSKAKGQKSAPQKDE
jgi:inhibitor of KinA